MDWDDAYSHMPYIPDAEGILARWEDEAAAYRTRREADGQAALGVAYGPSERMAYDVFLPDGTARGLAVFIHGGYWVKFDRGMFSHFAEGLRRNGFAVMLPSYDLCPAVTIAQITMQVATAITRAAAHWAGPIVIAGHSAGGHLAARMCSPGLLPDEVAARMAHVMPISPVSDLRPLLRTSMNDDFRLDEAMAEAESPALLRPGAMPVTVWVGGGERPSFLDQARWLAEAWGAAHVVAAGRNHFDVLDPLLDPESVMVQRLLTQS
ncbi:alpha/beta hydrolase [Roseovarius sp. SCSIO 43702]|uniref:alpha/beta hydrolase n=1 Tax=Roseovarius sp. SCSIO 43702 TaxID=2823043 RepID=UPI001C73DCB9|nr:alpha/beta hydrolase [Roseovarius sp. SCSIO 43702]QYX57514.1 alpha/beta hydrolase [Roseovarius sp. SCSIO 43702]